MVQKGSRARSKRLDSAAYYVRGSFSHSLPTSATRASEMFMLE
jgi:hypothetical protein